MRSCSSTATAARSSADKGLGAPSRRFSSVNVYSTTRSTRCTATPQLRAMSVALLAQGETVPRRGITTTRSPLAGPAKASP